MTQGRRRPTIRQVAALAGVSHQTVSRYLRFEGGLRPETVERVDGAISELGYRPNLLARSMRTRRTGMLAILVPGLVGVERTLAAACDEARAAGYRVEVLIGMDEEPAALSARARELLESGQVEGVLSVSPLAVPDGLGGAFVQAGEYDQRLRAVDAVAADPDTIAEIVRRLAEIGHRHLLHAAGPQDWTSARRRMTGYRAAVEHLGLVSHGEPEGPWHPETGIAAVASLPDDSPVTAVVAASDHIAAGVLAASLRRGWSVPGHLSITGWDDLQLLRYATPPMSTVVVDRETSARHAMRRLVAAVRGEPDPAPPEAAPGRIEFRGTTGPARR